LWLSLAPSLTHPRIPIVIVINMFVV
jgi:hypothetical protein